MLDRTEYLADILTFSNLEDRVKAAGMLMKDGSIGKISENRFARADLEHILLCVDDDMRMQALRQTKSPLERELPAEAFVIFRDSYG